ncbi:uncharacterized protein LOC135468653 [Liolophura sinensis]|uniref:uncharacterized protein LOC135468653 n=1 Tax=Liolophura sinensis TaxID=3198878 RepID=UPI003158E6C1
MAQLRRSLNLPEVPLTTPSDEIYGAVQCSEDSTRQMEMNMRAALEESSDELFTDEPPFSVDDDAISVPDSADENVSCHRARSLASTSNQRISDQGSNPVRFSNKKPTRLPDCRSSHLVTSSPDSSSGRPNAVNANASVESHCVDAQNETQVKQIDHVNSNYENNPAQNNCTSGEDESIVAENNCTSEQNEGIAAEDNSTGGQDESIPRDGNYNSGQEQGIPEGDNGISGQENQRHWFLGRVFSSVWNLLKYY